MKIIVTDCDHDKMVQEEEVFAKAGMTFTHLACKTEDDLIRPAVPGTRWWWTTTVPCTRVWST